MFLAIFFALTRPTELKLAHSTGTMVNILLDSFVEAVMTAPQRKEGPPATKWAAWHSVALIARSYYSYGIERVLQLLCLAQL